MRLSGLAVFAAGMGLASVNGINNTSGPLDLIGGILCFVGISVMVAKR